MHCYAPKLQEVEGANWFGPVPLIDTLSKGLEEKYYGKFLRDRKNYTENHLEQLLSYVEF